MEVTAKFNRIRINNKTYRYYHMTFKAKSIESINKKIDKFIKNNQVLGPAEKLKDMAY